MRSKMLVAIFVVSLLVTGCAGQRSSAPLANPAASQTVQPETEQRLAPSDNPAPRSSTVEQPAQEGIDEVGQCPVGIETPENIDPRACGPIPEGANNGGRGERFISPSGNIACFMKEDGVICEARDTVMIADFDNQEGDGRCNGFNLASTPSTLCASVPILWDGWDYGDPFDWSELSYGETVFVSEYVCSSESSGVTCWNSETGRGFLLSKARYANW